MTQVKTEKHLRQELKDASLSWWMDAAAKTIAEAGLNEKFLKRLDERAAKAGHPDIFKELQMPRVQRRA